MLERAAVGDRYVLERLQREGLAARRRELRAHLLCLDKHTTGDAIVAALAVLRALVEQRTTLAEATAGITLFPQRLINVPRAEGLRLEGERSDTRGPGAEPSPRSAIPGASCCGPRARSRCCA